MSYIILNLACGDRTSDRCVNVDWSVYLRIKRLPGSRFIAPFIFTGYRWERYSRTTGRLLVHDLRKGIPYPDSSVDAVYHSHFLEHLDHGAVPGFLREVRRVLKPRGIHRIVVPDLARLCRAYLDDFDRWRGHPERGKEHDDKVSEIIWHLVRTKAAGTALQSPLRRIIENLVLGDARARGEVHRWMYDDLSLSYLLREAGFSAVESHTHRTSGIPDWDSIGLDLGPDGGEYKPGSCYVEGQK